MIRKQCLLFSHLLEEATDESTNAVVDFECTPAQDAEIEALFGRYDTDGNGEIVFSTRILHEQN